MLTNQQTTSPLVSYHFDRPVRGAVIRSAQSWNYVSYSRSNGFYSAFTHYYNNIGIAGCRDYQMVAIHPLTMQRVTINGNACSPPYNIEKLNFKLAEKGTIPPDRSAPLIDMKLQVEPGQPDANRIVAGTTIVGTKLKLPLSIIDQAMGSATLTVKYKDLAEMPINEDHFTVDVPKTGVRHSLQKEEQAVLYKYDSTVNFNANATLNYFIPAAPGYYTFILDAKDAAGNPNRRSLELHVIQAGASLGTPVPGPPRVDAIFPEDKTIDIMVTTRIIATFSEPVQNVAGNFTLYDIDDPESPEVVPASVVLGIDDGRMQATLIPKGNLYYARNYQIVITSGVTDTDTPPTAMSGNFVATFRTKDPKAYDLASDQQFSGGRDIDLYTFTDIADERDTYAYVLAGDKGWRIIDVTRPIKPLVIHTANSLCNETTDPNCRKTPAEFNYRSVAVHPEESRALMAMTENIIYTDGNQFGYIRFYDLSSDPGFPPVIGREKLAEAYSGIPGRVALYGDYAVVNTAGAGVQIVNSKQAIKNQTDNKPSDGSSIVGALDTTGQGYGSPNDLAIFNERSAVFTTNPGWLLAVDLNLPTDQASVDSNAPVFPLVMNAFKPAGFSFTRIGVATDFPYTDSSGMEKSINLAVAGTLQGKITTIDLTDPTSPQILGEAVKEDDTPAIAFARDISVSKTAGLAFVTTYNAIQVYDIKNPTRPKLLNEITSLTDPNGAVDKDGNPIMIPIGETPAIVEKGGWVYLANASKGFRALDLDPVVLTLKSTSIKIDKPMQGKAINNEVYFSYTVTPEKDVAFKPTRAVLTVREAKSGVTIYEQKGIPFSAEKTHVIRFMAKDLGVSFSVTNRYIVKISFDSGGKPDVKEARIPLEWQAIATDKNRDGQIDASDITAATTGNIDRNSKFVCDSTNLCNGNGTIFPETTNKYYFWKNDNSDIDDVTGNSIPGSGSDYVNPKSTNTQSLKDSLKTKVAGKRDLVDYFPVILDIGELVANLPPASYTYTLKQSDEAVNYVETDLLGSAIKDYLTNVTTAQTLESKTKTQVKTNGVILGTLQANKAKIILVDGRKATRNPLVLEILDNANKDSEKNPEIVFRTEFPLSIDGVEQMFRQKNLIQEMYTIDKKKIAAPPGVTSIAGHIMPGDDQDIDKKRGELDRLVPVSDHFKEFDKESDGGDFVHVHGYNVNVKDSRGEQAEVFKRLYWSGSKARFWGITWYGFDSQYDYPAYIGTRSPNYHVNVRHAFNAGKLLKRFVDSNSQLQNATFSAHSLGNIVMSTAIQSDMSYKRYLMVNAAVAEEAYIDVASYETDVSWNASTRPLMFNPDWRYPNGVDNWYAPFLWQSEWYKLFPDTDARSKLTWRNNFSQVRNDKVYSFYAPTDEAFRPFKLTLDEVKDSPLLSSPIYDGKKTQYSIMWSIIKNWYDSWKDPEVAGTYAFSYNELMKGTERTNWVFFTDSKYSGWGFNLNAADYNTYSCTGPYDARVCTYITQNDANALYATKDVLRTKPLFNMNSENQELFINDPVTILTTPKREKMLANEIPALTFALGHRGVEKTQINNIDIRATFLKGNAPWPRDNKEWRHSDFINVAYPYLHLMYENWAE